MKKILVLSVPHTGTSFTRDYLLEVMPITLVPKYDIFVQTPNTDIVCNMHTTSQQRLVNERPENMIYDVAGYAIDNCKVVIPIRHPIKNALSCLIRKHRDLVVCTESWRVLFETYLSYDVFWVDIDVAQDKRRNMMEQLNTFIERDPVDQEKFDTWVDRWEPRNNNRDSHPLKKAYADNGELPKGFDFDGLDFAVEWYENKVAELNKLYS